MERPAPDAKLVEDHQPEARRSPHAERSRPVSSVSHRSLTHLGMDVHKDSISVAILRPNDSIDVERLFHDEDSVRRFIARMGDPRQLTPRYEAVPTRLLRCPHAP